MTNPDKINLMSTLASEVEKETDKQEVADTMHYVRMKLQFALLLETDKKKPKRKK